MKFDIVDNIDSGEFEEIEDRAFRNSLDNTHSLLGTT